MEVSVGSLSALLVLFREGEVFVLSGREDDFVDMGGSDMGGSDFFVI